MKQLLTILIVLIIGNVKSQEKIPNGCYRNISGNIYEFKNDTIEFFGAFDDIYTHGKGVYSISNNIMTCHYGYKSKPFYEIESKNNLRFNLDSIQISVNEKGKTISAMFLLKTLDFWLLLDTSEIKIARRSLPIKIKLAGCKIISVAESDLIDKNFLEVRVNTSNCDSIITGEKKYQIQINHDSILINKEKYILERKGCPKIIIIE